MSKKRLYEIAKEIGKESKEIVEKAKSLGLEVKSHASSVEENDAKRIVESFTVSVEPKAVTPTSKVEKEA